MPELAFAKESYLSHLRRIYVSLSVSPRPKIGTNLSVSCDSLECVIGTNVNNFRESILDEMLFWSTAAPPMIHILGLNCPTQSGGGWMIVNYSIV